LFGAVGAVLSVIAFGDPLATVGCLDARRAHPSARTVLDCHRLRAGELLRAELPDMILVSVSHRATVEQSHARQLALVGDGEWRLDTLTTGS